MLVRCNLGDANISSRPFESLRCVYTSIFVLGTIAAFECQAVYGWVLSAEDTGVSDAVQAPAG